MEGGREGGGEERKRGGGLDEKEELNCACFH